MSQRFKVVVTDFLSDAMETERRILGDLADVEALNGRSEDDLVGRVEDASALMVYHEISILRRTIERLRCCKLIIRCGVGYDNIDCDAARERGIPVANVPDYGTEEVADSAIGMTMSLARGITYLNSRLRANLGPWWYAQAAPIHRLRGRVFGAVGLGRIGTAAVLRAKALGMDVVFHDPYKPDGFDKALGIRRVEQLDDLLAQVYVLSLHCPLTEETMHLIDAKAIERMPMGSYLVNTARGAVVDVAAVPPAIESGRLAGAGIDVLVDEPPGEDNPLVAAWRDPQHPAHHRVLLNPHSAFYCEEGLMEMREKGSEACRRAILGLPIPNIVA